MKHGLLSILSFLLLLPSGLAGATPKDHVVSVDGAWKIQFHGDIQADDAKKIGALLNSWNSTMNQHDADAVAKLHTNEATIRGSIYTVAAYRDKEAKAFKKHADFKQDPAKDVYVTQLPTKNGYYLVFDESFTQSKKSSTAEIAIVVIRDGDGYKIDYESDLSTDRGLLKKMGESVPTAPTNCVDLKKQILMESPAFRYQYVSMYPQLSKTKTLSIECDEDECMFAENEYSQANHLSFDFSAMTMTDTDFRSLAGVDYDPVYAIHPKYAKQIEKMCKE